MQSSVVQQAPVSVKIHTHISIRASHSCSKKPCRIKSCQNAGSRGHPSPWKPRSPAVCMIFRMRTRAAEVPVRVGIMFAVLTYNRCLIKSAHRLDYLFLPTKAISFPSKRSNELFWMEWLLLSKQIT